MNKKLKDIFNNLEGAWILERTVYYVLSNTRDRAKGTALFLSMDSTTLQYKEEGFLFLSRNSKRIKFRREYEYRYVNETIEIYLADGVTKGLLFQKLEAEGENCSFKGTEHICRNDKHNGAYLFKNKNHFETSFNIKGATTNMEIKTIYRKAAASI